MKLSKFYKISSSIMAIALFISLQTSVQAQLTVINNTPCNLAVFAKQADNTTILPCDGCPPASGTTIVLAGGTATLGANPGCGIEFWQNFFWSTNFTFSPMGQSANPVLFGSCGTEIPGPCGFGTTVSWNLLTANGTGPATVTIQ